MLGAIRRDLPSGSSAGPWTVRPVPGTLRSARPPSLPCPHACLCVFFFFVRTHIFVKGYKCGVSMSWKVRKRCTELES